jgi:septal ring factor EnvC (AmiA/AmiB activator)
MDAAPDRTAHNAMVIKYKRLQLKHGDLVNDRQRLMEELAATQEILDKLQAEAECAIRLPWILSGDG